MSGACDACCRVGLQGGRTGGAIQCLPAQKLRGQSSTICVVPIPVGCNFLQGEEGGTGQLIDWLMWWESWVSWEERDSPPLPPSLLVVCLLLVWVCASVGCSWPHGHALALASLPWHGLYMTASVWLFLGTYIHTSHRNLLFFFSSQSL